MAHISQVRFVHQIQDDKDQSLLNKITSHSHSAELSARANENLYDMEYHVTAFFDYPD